MLVVVVEEVGMLVVDMVDIQHLMVKKDMVVGEEVMEVGVVEVVEELALVIILVQV